MLDFEVQTIDAVSPFLEYMTMTKPAWMAKAMKSFGWFAQQQIKAGIKSGAPGGERYAAFMPPGIRAKLEDGNKTKFPPLGKLANAVGYQYQPEDNSVLVGWLSASAVQLGEKIEDGSTTSVTEARRKFFWAHGVPLAASTTEIVEPPRPTYGPMKPVLQSKVVDYVQNKIIEYMENNNCVNFNYRAMDRRSCKQPGDS